MTRFNDQPWVEVNKDQPNFMTPKILERGRSGDWAYEISEGKGFTGDTIYGVTFLHWNGEKWDDSDASGLVYTLADAEERIHDTIN
jgi:hypothetical protein